jgi:hypothetical protein
MSQVGKWRTFAASTGSAARQYSGLEVFDAGRLKALEDENRKLKKLLARRPERNLLP